MRNDPRFSKGDPDVKVIEMAVEQYYKDTYNETTAHGSISDPIFELFIGNAQSYGPKIRPDIKANGLPVDNKLINGFNDKNKIFSTGFTKIPFAQISDDGTKKDILSIAHAYSIIGSDEKHVYIINPHDSSKTIKITRELFLANVENVVSADIPQK